VLSAGFIEHFEDPEKIVRCHLDLLRSGGLLIIDIPCLTGLHYCLSWLISKDVLRMHNLEIMNRRKFGSLFPPELVQPLFCGYWRGIDLLIADAEVRGMRALLSRVIRKLQLGLNIWGNLAPWATPFHARYSSHLLYVGRRLPIPSGE
jgi:hypothetical protein